MRTEQGCENRVGYGAVVGNEARGGGEGGRREKESREEEGREGKYHIHCLISPIGTTLIISYLIA